jgi:hypothetical protein
LVLSTSLISSAFVMIPPFPEWLRRSVEKRFGSVKSKNAQTRKK